MARRWQRDCRRDLGGHTVYHAPPTRFEGGTGDIADAVGLGEALEYVERIGIENSGRYEHGLLDYAAHHMQPIKGVKLIDTARDKASVLSFVLAGYSTDEVGKALNKDGIAVRTALPSPLRRTRLRPRQVDDGLGGCRLSAVRSDNRSRPERMGYSLADEATHADVIAFLATLAAP